jgi:hypothetical protein
MTDDTPKLSEQTLAEMAAGRAQLQGKHPPAPVPAPALPEEVTPPKRGPGRPKKAKTDDQI